MTDNFDITACGFTLANAKVCARAAADAYTLAPQLISPLDGTRVLVRELVDSGCVLIAFEGSKNPRQFLTDAEAWRENIEGCSIHRGFLATFQSIADALADILKTTKPKPIVVTGHSLGGALAQICGHWLEQYWFNVHSIYTFGGPRVANAAGVKRYGTLAARTYRVINGADIVPWCPGVLAGYRHAGIPYWMNRIGGSIGHPALLAFALGDALELYREWQRGKLALLTDHFMDSYISQLNTL